MDILTGEVTGLAFGGHGIIRQDGLVIFVPFTAPGDLITCRITRKKKNFAYGEVVTILKPSAKRITPRCPYFGICGGCQLQHLGTGDQLDYKQQCVADALQRIGGFTAASVEPTIGAEQTWAYRRHVTFQLLSENGTFKMGYTAIDNTTLLEITTCPIFLEAGAYLLSQMHDTAGSFKNIADNDGRVTVLKLDSGNYAFHYQFRRLPDSCQEILEEALAAYPTWKGIIVTTPQKTLVLGSVEPSLAIDNLTFSFSPRAFIQNHPEQSLNIYRHVRSLATQANATRALDLYCGIGITSLLLAKEGIAVCGVECNKEAIDLAKNNAAKNGISNAEFLLADVKTVIGNVMKKVKPDFVVVNPPRNGMDLPVVQALAKGSAQQIVYISCMPSTLARDLKLLCQEKYTLIGCQPYDMFPQTSHVETIAHLKRKGI